MDFQEFWTGLSELMATKRDFETIHDQKPFHITPSKEAIRVDSDTIKTPRVVKKQEFLKVYRASKEHPDDPFHPGHYSKLTVNASYIVTLFEQIKNMK